MDAHSLSNDDDVDGHSNRIFLEMLKQTISISLETLWKYLSYFIRFFPLFLSIIFGQFLSSQNTHTNIEKRTRKMYPCSTVCFLTHHPMNRVCVCVKLSIGVDHSNLCVCIFRSFKRFGTHRILMSFKWVFNDRTEKKILCMNMTTMSQPLQ